MTAAVPPDALPLDQLELSVRTYHACWNGGARTVGDVRRAGSRGMARYPAIGRKALAEIEAAIGTWAPVGELPLVPVALAGIPTADLVAELAKRFAVD